MHHTVTVLVLAYKKNISIPVKWSFISNLRYDFIGSYGEENERRLFDGKVFQADHSFIVYLKWEI